MKNPIFIFLSIIIIFFFGSCDNMTEEIYLNEDGSGEYIVYADMIPSMVKMAGMFMAMDTTIQGTDEEKLAMIEAKVWDDIPAEIDSIMPFKDAKADHIKNDPEKSALAERVTGFMKGGKNVGYVNSGIRLKFKNMDELDLLMEMMNDNANERNRMAGETPDVETEADYSFKKRTFKRVCTYITHSEPSAEDDAMMNEMMGPDSKFKTIIHLPKNVKSVKGANMAKKMDRRVEFEYNMIDVSNGKADTNFEIKFNKK